MRNWRAARAAGRCTAFRWPSRTWPRRPASAPRSARRWPIIVPAHDGLMVARMRRAGAIVVGKTNTPEFGLGSHTYNAVFGITRNAWDATRTAGGSERRRGGQPGPAHAAGGRRQRHDGLAAQPGRVQQRFGLRPSSAACRPARPATCSSTSSAPKGRWARTRARRRAAAVGAGGPRRARAAVAARGARGPRAAAGRSSRRAACASAGSATSAATCRSSRASSTSASRRCAGSRRLGCGVEPASSASARARLAHLARLAPLAGRRAARALLRPTRRGASGSSPRRAGRPSRAPG